MEIEEITGVNKLTVGEREAINEFYSDKLGFYIMIRHIPLSEAKKKALEQTIFKYNLQAPSF